MGRVKKLEVRRDSLTVVTILFLAIFGVFEFAILGAGLLGYLEPLMNFTAEVAGWLIDLIGIPTIVVGNQIYIASRILQIDIDCTALAITALYTAFVIAYPLGARIRALALLLGIPVIAIANQLRLIGVAVASEQLSQSTFVFVHDYLFKIVMIFVVVALWATVLQIARGNAKTT